MKQAWIFGIALSFLSASTLAATFDSYDTNNNNQISKDEFYGAVSDTGTFADFDADGDGLVDEDEFAEIGGDWDYDTWDANDDGYLDSGEFYDGYYVEYDEDENGHWDDGEWDDAGEGGLFDT